MDLTSKSQEELDSAGEIKTLKKIEAALFISARYLSIQELVEYTDINPLLLKELLEKLSNRYRKEGSAIEILEKNGLWKMDVKQEYHRMINKMATGNAEFSKAEQETLAIIAYKQPVKQSIIVKIRGNKAYDHIKHFIENGLLRAKKMGHTKELNLSEEFYEYFKLQKLSSEDKLSSKNKDLSKTEGESNEKQQKKEVKEKQEIEGGD